jgi:hypothetical protein
MLLLLLLLASYPYGLIFRIIKLLLLVLLWLQPLSFFVESFLNIWKTLLIERGTEYVIIISIFFWIDLLYTCVFYFLDFCPVLVFWHLENHILVKHRRALNYFRLGSVVFIDFHFIQVFWNKVIVFILVLKILMVYSSHTERVELVN